MVPEILQIGDPRLRVRCTLVEGASPDGLKVDAERLSAALACFRVEHGFGRAIAASQIGITRRLIAMSVPGWPSILVNPEITWRSDEKMTLWDDCMCFPYLLARVSRHQSISVKFQTLEFESEERRNCDKAISELLQHEIDHLDGILATDRAEGPEPLVSRTVFERERGYFAGLVDYDPMALRLDR
jgi:peptide deformylase